MNRRSSAGATAHPDAPAAGPTDQAAGLSVPLSALRYRLDAGSSSVRWPVHADGLLDRALVMDTPATVTFPLKLEGNVELSARAMLFPHDWRDLSGGVRASVTATDEDGRTTVLWTGTLRAGDHGRPRGHHVQCVVPAATATLELSAQADGPTDADQETVSRVVWVEPALTDPHAPPPPTPATSTPAEDHSHAAPLISVLTPVHDPPPHMLEEAIASVRNQTYAHWQLCLVDDGSTNPQIITALQQHANSDPRIHLTRHDTPHGIAQATNAALNLATGDYIALLDHDDTLTPDALQHIAERITTDPTLDMLYSDEDTVLDGRRVWAHLKPAWSPDTLRTNGYTCHLGVYRRALVQEIGGFRTEFNGSQDVDMILRLTERTDRIAHVPRILYHWRAHRDSTAGGEAKPYAYVAARNAISAHLGRIGLAADVGFGPPGLYRVAHRVEPALTVDLVLDITTTDGLAGAAENWIAQPHPSWNLVLAAPDAALDAVVEQLTRAGLPEDRITVVAGAGLHAAAAAATAEHLLLMQTPAAGLTHDWLTRLLGYSAQAGIAAAGPVLLAPDGRIHQAGIALPQGIPLHVMHGTRSSMDEFFGYGTSVYNVSAVSGILATPRATYQQLGGLDPTYGELALIDYCLRAADHHQRTVIVPDARLRTTGEGGIVSPTNDLPTLWRLRNTWARTHTHDPYYNPNYRTDRGDFQPGGHGS